MEKVGHVTLTLPILGWFDTCTLRLCMVNLPNKFEVSYLQQLC